MSSEPSAMLARRAAQLISAGRLAEALEVYQQLVAIEPDQPDHWYDLAHLQGRTRRFDEALTSYQQALDRGVRDREEVHVNRSVILDHLERRAEAEAELRAALAIRPGFVPALLNLGLMQEDRGARHEARKSYQGVIEAEPDNALALARLVGLTPKLKRDDPLTAEIRRALAREDISDLDKATLGFALGQALDSAGAYDEGFAAFAAANRANEAHAARAGLRYDPGAHEDYVDRMIAAFPEPASGAAGDAPPLFICGMFRSGSTLVERILAGHPHVTSGGELDLLPTLVRTRLHPYPESLASAGQELIDDVRRAYLSGVRTLHPDAAFVTDKRPDNFLHIGLIKMLFPKARIVHTCRNPIDNCLSVYFLHLNPRMTYAHRLDHIAHWYRQYRRLMAHWKSLYGDDILDLDYDRLVAAPEPEVRRLLDFCGLDWNEKCLDFHAAEGVVKTASVWQVREPLYQRSSGRWRHYERHIADLRRALGD